MTIASCIGRTLAAALVFAACGLAVSSPAAAAARAYVGNFKDGTVTVVDTQKAAAVATIAVGAGPHGMAVSNDQRTVFVSLDGASTVAAIDTASERVTRRVEVGKSPHGLAMLADGSMLLVAVFGEDRVAWVDAASGAVVGGTTVAKPHTIAVDPQMKTAYVASQDAADPGLAVIDLATRTVVRRIRLPKVPRDLEYRFDGGALYFTMAGENAVQVLDPATERVTATIATGASPHLASVFKGAASGLVVVQGPGEVLRFDPATNRPGPAIRVGDQPHWMAAFDQGRDVAVTNEGSNTLSLVDLSTDAVRTVAVGQAPRKVVVVQGAAIASSAASGDRTTEASVSIRDFAFRPARLVVAAGTTITWSNDDGSPHGIEFDDRSPGEDLLFPGKRFARRFADAGTFAYHCSIHPYMSGSIDVTAR